MTPLLPASAEDRYLVAHGSGHCLDMLNETAKGKDVNIEHTDQIQDVSLQGPKSLEVLNPHTAYESRRTEIFSSGGNHAVWSRRRYFAYRLFGRNGF